MKRSPGVVEASHSSVASRRPSGCLLSAEASARIPYLASSPNRRCGTSASAPSPASSSPGDLRHLVQGLDNRRAGRPRHDALAPPLQIRHPRPRAAPPAAGQGRTTDRLSATPPGHPTTASSSRPGRSRPAGPRSSRRAAAHFVEVNQEQVEARIFDRAPRPQIVSDVSPRAPDGLGELVLGRDQRDHPCVVVMPRQPVAGRSERRIQRPDSGAARATRS
jgi:hypothetical protein